MNVDFQSFLSADYGRLYNNDEVQVQLRNASAQWFYSCVRDNNLPTNTNTVVAEHRYNDDGAQVWRPKTVNLLRLWMEYTDNTTNEYAWSSNPRIYLHNRTNNRSFRAINSFDFGDELL